MNSRYLLVATAVIVATLIGCTWWLVHTLNTNEGYVESALEEHGAR